MKTFLVLLLLMLIMPGPVVQAMPEPVIVAQIAVPSATPRVTSTPWLTIASTRTPTATMIVLGPSVSILSEDLPAYTYHLDSLNRRVFVGVDPIPRGRLIKVATCLDGYSQIEYQPDMGKPGLWRVVFAKTDMCQ